MPAKLISIIIGLVITLGTGTLVYKTKQPAYIPPATPDTTVTSTSAPTSVKPTPTPTIINKGGESDDDEDGEDGGTVTNTPVTTPPPTPAVKPTTPTTPSGITMAQIAQHNSRNSCWSVINGSVYDLTSWIPNHPGGEQNILRLCGIDGSSAYNGKHGGSQKTATILGGFKLGVQAN